MIEKLEMFLALAREQHFGRAAVACGITQPSLSAGIKQLEDQLGVKLVYRGSRFQGLTPEGQRALDWARRIVGDARSLKDEMRSAQKGFSGNLRLAVIPTALPLVADLTSQFAKAHPNVHLTVLSRTSGEILSMLENLETDAGVTYLDNEPLGQVTSVPIYTERYALVTHRDHPLASRDTLKWGELAGLPLCLLTPDMQNRRIVSEHLTAAGIETDPMLQASSLIVLISHVLRGDWVSILPQTGIEIFLQSGDLKAIPLVNPSAAQRVGLVAPFREPHTPVLRALLTKAGELAAKQDN
ncbi:MAG: LysR family transcriptional regulator [Thalassovita sp.]